LYTLVQGFMSRHVPATGAEHARLVGGYLAHFVTRKSERVAGGRGQRMSAA